MSIKIKLDTNAVRELIKDDDDILVELQRSVVSNIVRGICPKDADALKRNPRLEEIIAQAANAQFDNLAGDKKGNLKKIVDERVAARLDKEIELLVARRIKAKLKEIEAAAAA